MLFARMRWSVPLFAVALCVTTASDALASGPVSLRWSAPKDCPTGDEVLDEVNRLLGPRAVAEEQAFDVVADVQRKDDGTYVVRLEIPSADGPRVREVSAVSCSALGQATALILAMMVDPEAALSAAPPPEAPSPEPPSRQTEPKGVDPGQTVSNRENDAAPQPPPLSLETSSRSSISKNLGVKSPVQKSIATRRPQLLGSLRFLGDVGSLPGPAVGMGGAFGIFPGQWRFEIGVAYLGEKTGGLALLPKAGSNVNLLAFHAAGGIAILIHPKIEFTPRIRFEVGRFHASSFGVSNTGEGSGASFGVGIGGLVSVQIARYVRVGLGLDGVALLAYPRFIVTGVGVAHEPSPVVGRLALETEVRF